MNGQCDFCKKNSADPNFTVVTGVVERRGQGGSNHIIGKLPTGQQICASCVNMRRKGIDPMQGTLL